MPPPEWAITTLPLGTTTNHNSASLYLGKTDRNVANAVALLNSESDERSRLRRPLANGSVGYEDKYGVIHLDFSTDDEIDDEVEVVGSAANDKEQNGLREYGESVRWGIKGALNIQEQKVVPLITEHPRQRAALFQHEEVPEATSRSSLDAKIALNSTGKRASKNRQASDRDSPEEYSAPLNLMTRTDHDEVLQRLRRDHRGKHAKGLKTHGLKKLGAADQEETRKSKSFESFTRILKTGQDSRPGNTLPTYSSPSKRIIGVTPPTTPRTRMPNAIIHVTTSKEDQPYMAPEHTAQSRLKQAKKKNSGVAKVCTPRANVSSDPFGSYPTPPRTSSNLKTRRMRSNKSNPQNPSTEILASAFHRSSFESMSPLAMKFDYYNTSKTHRRRRHTSEIPLRDLYHSKKSKERCQNQRDDSEIPLQDLYLAPHSPISNFSIYSALNLAREKKKCLLVNIQSATVPACRILNRELWRHAEIADIISQSFLFLQINHNDERAKAYIGNYYGVFALDEESEGMVYAGNNGKIIQLPHIALLDPFSGHRWKVWDGPGLPDKNVFLADLREYELAGE